MIFILSSYLSKLFDFLYAASLDDKEDILYLGEKSPDLNLLLSHLNFSEPNDSVEHKKATLKGCNEIDYYVALAAKTFKSADLIDQVSDLFSWVLYYKDKKNEYLSDGEFAKILLNKEALHRLINIIEYIRTQPLEVNQNILIPISLADELELEDLDNLTQPMMIEEDLRLPFKMAYDGYNQEEYIKANIVCEYDWNGVDWRTAEHTNPKCAPAFFETVYLHFHGGGFMLGSSFESQPWTIKIAKEKKCPVFTVDYRLAPKYKFPVGISDSWIFYMWIIKYAKRYLNIDFDRIVLTGDSAGGNIVLGITSLAIQNEVNKRMAFKPKRN